MQEDGHHLVYGLIPHQESLAFLPEAAAMSLAQELEEIRSLRTVREARAFTSQYSIVPGLDTLEEEGAADTDSYSAIETSEYIDGDWPRMVTQMTLEYLPAGVASAIGKPVESVLNGRYLEIAPDSQEHVLATLGKFGYECRRDDELVLRCELIAEADISDGLSQVRAREREHGKTSK